MKWVFKKLSIPFLAITLPLFPFEIFLGFIFLNIMNKISDVPPVLPINLNFNR